MPYWLSLLVVLWIDSDEDGAVTLQSGPKLSGWGEPLALGNAALTLIWWTWCSKRMLHAYKAHQTRVCTETHLKWLWDSKPFQAYIDSMGAEIALEFTWLKITPGLFTFRSVVAVSGGCSYVGQETFGPQTCSCVSTRLLHFKVR